MIASKNRAWYMGCSDCDKIVGNMNTATWNQWWMEKLGLYENTMSNKYTTAGTAYEHRILEMINPDMTLDYQIIFEELCVRANYDGIEFRAEKMPMIHEIKTFNENREFKVTKTYWRQAQMEMWALGKKTGANVDRMIINAYPLNEEHYNNFWLPLDEDKLETHLIKRDDDFISGTLEPRIKYLGECLRKRIYPKELINGK